MKKFKICIPSLIFVLITLLISSGLCFFICTKKQTPKILQANDSVWDFAQGAVCVDKFAGQSAFAAKESSYGKFEIGSLAALKNFEISMEKGRCEFENRVVLLAADIDCKGADIVFGWEDGTLPDSNNVTFKGVFDGQSHTISNVTRSIQFMYSGENQGLFCRNAGTIKDTRLKNFYYTNGSEGAKYLGIIVGKNTGIIENCIVEDCKFLSNRFRTNCYVAPIAGQNLGIVKNCIVRGNYLVGGQNKNVWPVNPDGAMSYYFTASGNNAINSIFCATWGKCGNEGCYDYVYSPVNSDTDGGSVDARNSWNYSNCESAYDWSNKTQAEWEEVWPDKSGDNWKEEMLAYRSSFSSTCGETGTLWFKYKAKSYGYGGDETYCVYLRSFIGWTTYLFRSDDNTMGTVSATSLIVPTDYSDITIDGSAIKTSYKENVRAISKEQYSFLKWESSGKSYTAYFTGKVCDISFWNTNEDVIVETYGTMALETDYYMAYGSNLKIIFDKCPKTTQEYTYWDNSSIYPQELKSTAYCLNSLTFEFYAKDEKGNYKNRKITYKSNNLKKCLGVDISGIYCIDRFSIYQEGDNEYKPYIGEDFDAPMLLDKFYSITFG